MGESKFSSLFNNDPAIWTNLCGVIMMKDDDWAGPLYIAAVFFLIAFLFLL